MDKKLFSAPSLNPAGCEKQMHCCFSGRKKTSFFLLLMLFAILCGNIAFAQSPEGLATHTMENGLDVLLLPIPSADTITISLVFNAGASAQTSRTAGLFKMLEQILFRGPTLSPGEPEPAGAIASLSALSIEGGAELDRFGASMVLEPARLKQGLDTLAFLFSKLRLDTAVSDEKALADAKHASLAAVYNSLSDPFAIYEATLARKLFATAPWRLDLAGADYLIESATPEDLKVLAATWLVPNNAALIVTGSFLEEEALAAATKAFESWAKGNNPWQTPYPPMPKPGVTRPILMVFPDPSIIPGQALIEMRYRGPDTGNPRAITAELWATLSAALDSRLPKAVTAKMPSWSKPSLPSILYHRSRFASWFSVSVKIAISTTGSAADAVLAFKETVRGTEMYAMKSNSSYFSQAEYNSAKEALLARRAKTLLDARGSAAILSDAWIWGGISNISKWESALKAQTSKDMLAFADEYFMKNLEVVSIRLSPEEYTPRKKSFDSYGFETGSLAKAFWWR
jgi:predicted Zn-dependent peptidase